MDTELKEIIKRELPAYLREDPAFRAFVLDLTREAYADRAQTTDWFSRPLLSCVNRAPARMSAGRNTCATAKRKIASGISKSANGKNKTASGTITRPKSAG
ncbi:hypothetical protein [Rhabdochromatium marinum]|uniref:hypothetical protein n=1 Tax=Rhabdochromatium marinum TaxID=48729 RepID=UPI00308407F0